MPYECISVDLELDLYTVNISNVKTYESLCYEDKYNLCEDTAYFILHRVTENVYSLVIRSLIAGKTYEMNITN